MQFVEGGPEIPISLVNDLLADRAVFFCGAGVSRNEGLPDFGQLTEKAVEELTIADPIISEHLCHGRYDAVFQIIFDEVVEERIWRFLKNALSFPEHASYGAHTTLLGLAMSRPGHQIRLVTTNFDCGFTLAAERMGIELDVHTAPRLPPVRPTWWSIVELHGSLGQGKAHDLVLTSGQFGRAYMTEGWAARFVAELFRQCTIVFVGYSVEDPVMRYVVDAYRAVDPQRSDIPKPFSFVGSSPDKRDALISEWKRKHVEPVWYETNGTIHDNLYNSLQKLAELKKAGAAAPRIVISQLCRGPATLLLNEEKSQIEWALNEIRFRSETWLGDGPPPIGVIGALARYSPPLFESWMSLLRELKMESSCRVVATWPRTISEIWTSGQHSEHSSAGEWILKQLESPSLIKWVLEEGGFLSPATADTVLSALPQKTNNPYVKAWTLICHFSVNPPYWTQGISRHSYWIYSSSTVHNRADGLVGIMMPAIRLRNPYGTFEECEVESVDNLVRPEVVLPLEEHIEHAVTHLYDSKDWVEVLRLSADRLIDRLNEMGVLIRRVEGVIGHIPSDIAYSHDVDDSFPPTVLGDAWKILPALAEQSLYALWGENHDAVIQRVHHWLRLRHSVVHERVALKFLRKHAFLSPKDFVWVLRSSASAVLDDYECRMYLRQILPFYARKMSPKHKKEAAHLIDSWRTRMCSTTERSLQRFWNEEAAELLLALYGSHQEFQDSYPELVDILLKRRKRIEDKVSRIPEGWIGHKSIPDISTTSIDQLVHDLGTDEYLWYQFSEWVQQHGPEKAIAILRKPGIENSAVSACMIGIIRWLDKRESANVTDPAEVIMETIELLEDETVSSIAESVTRSLCAISHLRLEHFRKRLIAQYDRCLKLGIVEGEGVYDTRDHITDTINSRAYDLLEALTSLLPQRIEPPGSKMPVEIGKRILKLLSIEGTTRARSSLTLTRRLLYFFTLDKEWTHTHLLPLLSDTDLETAKYAWSGYLWNPKFSPSLAKVLMDPLSRAIELLQDDEFVRPNLGAFPVALHYFYRDVFSINRLRAAMSRMHCPLLAEAIRGIQRFLPDQSELAEAWNLWIHDVLESGFPSRRDSYCSETSLSIVDLLIALEPVVAEAYKLVEHCFVPTTRFGHCIYRMKEGEPSFISRHPRIALQIVRRTALVRSLWQLQELHEFLAVIIKIDPSLESVPEYLDLIDITERCTI